MLEAMPGSVVRRMPEAGRSAPVRVFSPHVPTCKTKRRGRTARTGTIFLRTDISFMCLDKGMQCSDGVPAVDA
jgi:hypothetical protein